MTLRFKVEWRSFYLYVLSLDAEFRWYLTWLRLVLGNLRFIRYLGINAVDRLFPIQTSR